MTGDGRQTVGRDIWPARRLSRAPERLSDVAHIILLLVATFLAPALATAQGLSVVSAASYVDLISPDSWAAAYPPEGSTFSLATQIAEPGDDGRFPTELGSVTVEVAGEPAEIYFISPGQINFLVPPQTGPGLISVVIGSRGTAVTFSTQVQVLNASPGLFSRDSSGSGAGAILNAVTYEAEPFRVRTEANAGGDKRTRLSIYGTGFRFADPLRAILRIPSGDQFAVDLEYWGEAPGFFGLDQANLPIPAELDADVTVSVSLETSQFRSNEVTFRLEKLPPEQVRLEELLLSAGTVLGGESLTGTVRLNARAPVSGVTVQLDSFSPLVSVQSQVVISEGEVAAAFPISTGAPLERTDVEIRARSGGVTLIRKLTIETRSAVRLSAVRLNPQVITGGASGSGTVELMRPLPSGSLRVTLSSGDPEVVRFNTENPVTILAGQQSGAFGYQTTAVSTVTDVPITASIEGSQVVATLRVRPAVTIAIRPDSVIGGNPVDIEIQIAEPAEFGNATVEVFTQSPNVSLPSRNIFIPAPQTVKVFRVNTLPVVRDEEVTVNALHRGTLAQATLTLKSPASSVLDSLALNPTTVTGGQLVTGSVTLTGPAPLGGITVTLSADFQGATAIQTIPSQITVDQGNTSANFTIKTNRVVFATNVTIRARAGDITKTAKLTVNP